MNATRLCVVHGCGQRALPDGLYCQDCHEFIHYRIERPPLIERLRKWWHS